MTFIRKAGLAFAGFAATSIPFVIGVINAQTLPPPPAYTYDAVSIHKSDPAERNVHMGDDGPQGGLRTVNTSVLLLIAGAYDVQNYQIVGAPGWASSEHFDVALTPDRTEIVPDISKAPQEWQTYWKRNQQRLQAVLRDRFGLVVRAETRELPIYVLTQAKKGNKLSAHAEGGHGPSIGTNGDRQIRGTDATMAMLATQLSMQLGRPVHDKTGLDGRYDFRIDWVPDLDIAAASGSAATGPSFFTAITDQLGLRLESTKGPVPVYVVEKIEQPSEN